MADETKPQQPPVPAPVVTSSISDKAKEWFLNNKQNVIAYIILLVIALGIPAWGYYGESYRQVKLAGENIIEINAYGGPDAYWEPYNLELDASKTYTFRLISHDVTHKFSLPQKEIDVRVEPGHPVEFQVTFEPGTYYFRCMSWCGLGHQDMIGKIEVT